MARELLHVYNTPLTLTQPILWGSRLPLSAMACSLLPQVLTSLFCTIWLGNYRGDLKRLSTKSSVNEDRKCSWVTEHPNDDHVDGANVEYMDEEGLSSAGLAHTDKYKDTPPNPSPLPKCSARVAIEDRGGSPLNLSKDVLHLQKLEHEHNLAKAVQLDDMAVPVHIWNNAICHQVPSEKEYHAIEALKSFSLRDSGVAPRCGWVFAGSLWLTMEQSGKQGGRGHTGKKPPQGPARNLQPCG